MYTLAENNFGPVDIGDLTNRHLSDFQHIKSVKDYIVDQYGPFVDDDSEEYKASVKRFLQSCDGCGTIDRVMLLNCEIECLYSSSDYAFFKVKIPDTKYSISRRIKKV